MLRIMTFSNRRSRINTLYKQLEILQFHDIYKLEISKLMHQLRNNNLPRILTKLFVPIQKIHTHQTRLNTKMGYFLPQTEKSLARKIYHTE